MAGNPVYYCLLIEVDPERGKPYLNWLLGGHIEDVSNQPGFLSAKLIAFEEKAADGWDRYMAQYTLKNLAALDAYWQSDPFKRYGKEAKEFEGTFRIQRLTGDAVISLD